MLTAHLSAIEEAVRALYQKTIFVPNVPETRDIRNHVIDRNAVKALIDSSFNRETVLNAVARARFDFHHDVEEDWIECGVNTEGYLRPIDTHFDDSRREFLNYLGKGFRFDPNNFAFYRPTCGSTEAQTASLHEFINRRRCADSAERPLVIACRDGHIANLAKKLIVADVKEYDNPCDINAILLEFKERCVKICLSYPLEDIDDETFENLLECLDAQENVEVLLDVTGFTPGSNIALKHSCIKDVTFSLDSHLGLDTDYMGFYLHSTFGLNKRLTSGEIDEPTFAKEKNAVFSPLYGHMWFMNLHSMREATGLLKELNDETLLPHDAEKSIESKSRVKNALWDGNLKYCLSQEGFSDEEVTEIVCALHNARADIIWQSLETRMQNAVKLIDTWFDWAKDTVMPDRSSFMYAYPTNGASESIRTVINDFGIGAKRHPLVCTFNAEYEGFSAYAKAAHIEVRQLNRGKTEQDWRDVIDKISELSRTRDVLFGVTQPSSLNGCIWSEFNAFMQELSDRAPSISVMLDITYLGCTAERIPRILTDFAVVKNIAFSLSKPGGMYYDRIGGLLSKHARPSLEANARHLNPDSVLYGIQWMKDYAAGEIPGKYRQVTEKLTEQLNALLKTLARKYPELTMPVMRTSDVMGIVYGEPSKNPSELERYYTRYSAEGIPLLVRMNTTPSLAVAVGNDIAPDTEKIIDMLLQEKALCEPYAFEKKILNDPMGEYVKLRARLDQDGPLAPFPELEPVVRKLIEKLEGGEVVRIARMDKLYLSLPQAILHV